MEKKVKMKDIKLNSILMNGATVSSVMKISNIDDKGDQKETLYEMKNGENSKSVFVTGSHLVYKKSIKNFVKVKDLKENVIKTTRKCEELSCLITSNHTIHIGEWIFHDWEDKND